MKPQNKIAYGIPQTKHERQRTKDAVIKELEKQLEFAEKFMPNSAITDSWYLRGFGDFKRCQKAFIQSKIKEIKKEK